MNNIHELKRRMKHVVSIYNGRLLIKTEENSNFHFWLIIKDDELILESGRPGAHLNGKRFERKLKDEAVSEAYDLMINSLKNFGDQKSLDILFVKNDLIKEKINEIKVKELKWIPMEIIDKNIADVIKRIKNEIDWIDNISNDQIIEFKRAIEKYEYEEIKSKKIIIGEQIITEAINHDDMLKTIYLILDKDFEYDEE